MSGHATQTRATSGFASRGPGLQDRGERYRVVYRDGLGVQRTYGFTDSMDEARKWAAKIRKNPMWKAPGIRERRA